MSALVGVIMGSKSDWSTLSHTAEMLDKLGIPYEVKVVSAHRTPDLLFQYAEQAEERGIPTCRSWVCRCNRRCFRALIRCCRSCRCRPAFQLLPWPSARLVP